MAAFQTLSEWLLANGYDLGLIAAGKVRVNGVVIKSPTFPLLPGSVVTVKPS